MRWCVLRTDSEQQSIGNRLLAKVFRGTLRLIGGLVLLAAIFFGLMTLGLAFSARGASISDLLMHAALFFVCLVGGALLLAMGSPDLTMREIRTLPGILVRGIAANWRFNLCVASYWLVFILAPTGAVAYVVWPDHASAFVCGIGVFVPLVLIGERGFRYWKRLWKFDRV